MIEKYLSDSNMRAELLLKFQGKQEGSDTHEGWQDQSTPLWLARDMVALVPDPTAHQWVVLFNHEFLEVLLFERGVPADQIMFMADCYGEGMLSATIYRVKTFILPDDCRDPKRTIELLVPKIEKAFYNGEPMPKTNNLVVVGNPPYNKPKTPGSNRSGTLYNLFVEVSIKVLKPRYSSFVIPSRWMLGGQGLDAFRGFMLAGGPIAGEYPGSHISKIVDFKSATKVFNAEIAGGVCYYLWDREHEGLCSYGDRIRKLDEFDVFIRDNVGLDIVRKVLFHWKNSFISSNVSVQTPYGITTNTVPSSSGVPCWFTQKQGRLFTDPKGITDPRKDLNKWKVLAPKTPIAGQTDFNKPIRFFSPGNLILAAPGECCSQTYLVINSFASEQEALNFKEYMLTKFFRFMLLMRVVSQDVMSEKYSWVPDLGSYTTAPTDEQLFKMFGLSNKEIEYINSRIK